MWLWTKCVGIDFIFQRIISSQHLWSIAVKLCDSNHLCRVRCKLPSAITGKFWPAFHKLWLSQKIHHMWEAHISTNYNEGVSSSQEDFTIILQVILLKYVTKIKKEELVCHQQPQPLPVYMIDRQQLSNCLRLQNIEVGTVTGPDRLTRSGCVLGYSRKIRKMSQEARKKTCAVKSNERSLSSHRSHMVQVCKFFTQIRLLPTIRRE